MSFGGNGMIFNTGWHMGQSSGNNTVKDFFLFDNSNGQFRLVIATSGTVSYGSFLNLYTNNGNPGANGAHYMRGLTGTNGHLVINANGNVLNNGDTVLVIKDLKVKGSSIPLKQGSVIRNIRLVEGDDEHIEGHSDKIKDLVLKVCFLKKA